MLVVVEEEFIMAFLQSVLVVLVVEVMVGQVEMAQITKLQLVEPMV